jgi:hypothetical protein
MRKKKKNITFKRKNIFIRFFGREEEDVPIRGRRNNRRKFV